MRVLHGQVTVLGYIAQPSSDYIDLYAPYNHQAVVIDTLDPLHSELAHVKRHVPTREDEQDELAELALSHVTKKHVAVIALCAMESNDATYQSTTLFRQLFEYPARRVSSTDEAANDTQHEVDSAYDPLELGDMHVVSRIDDASFQCAHSVLTERPGDIRQRRAPSTFTAARVAHTAQTAVDDQHAASAVHLRQKGQRQIDAGSLAEQLIVVQVSAALGHAVVDASLPGTRAYCTWT